MYKLYTTHSSDTREWYPIEKCGGVVGNYVLFNWQPFIPPEDGRENDLTTLLCGQTDGNRSRCRQNGNRWIWFDFFSQLQRTSLEVIYTGQFSKHDLNAKKMSVIIYFNNKCIEILTFGILKCKNYIFKFLIFFIFCTTWVVL